MPKKPQTDKPKRRTQVEDLPKEEKALEKDELKKVKGGVLNSYLWVGSAKPK